MKKTILLAIALLFTGLSSMAGTTAVNDTGPPAEQPTVIIQVGSGTLYAGLSSGNAPSVLIPHNFAPQGIIDNWSGFESTIAEVFSQLGVNSTHAIQGQR